MVLELMVRIFVLEVANALSTRPKPEEGPNTEKKTIVGSELEPLHEPNPEPENDHPGRG